MNNLQKYDHFIKKVKTLNFVVRAINQDLNKISKKSREYKSMKMRKQNLSIECLKTRMKLEQIGIDVLREEKRKMIAL